MVLNLFFTSTVCLPKHWQFFYDFISFQINTAPKNVNVISQEDFAKLRSNAKRKSSTGEAIPAPAAGPVAAATHAQPTTPQNTPAVGSMKVPPSVRVEELEGTTPTLFHSFLSFKSKGPSHTL